MAKKVASLTIDQKMDLHFELDAEKVAAIKKCLEKGKLTISINKVDLTSLGRSGNPYIYD
jgi:anti-sigma28 factor (negative regulator of flagellin synthesis)